MKKLHLIPLVLLILSSQAPVYAQHKASPRELDNFVRRVCPMENIINGAYLEHRYDIKEFRDGKWSCDDRAEVAKRVANQYGYRTAYGIDKTNDPKIFHRFVVVTDHEGNDTEILRSIFRPSEK